MLINWKELKFFSAFNFFTKSRNNFNRGTDNFMSPHETKATISIFFQIGYSNILSNFFVCIRNLTFKIEYTLPSCSIHNIKLISNSGQRTISLRFTFFNAGIPSNRDFPDCVGEHLYFMYAKFTCCRTNSNTFCFYNCFLQFKCSWIISKSLWSHRRIF